MFLCIQVGESVATTVYEIVRPATIPSDNIEHKVTVGLIDIKPTICYTCVPKRVPQAYMIAKVVNGSAYTFLRGETSIFLDNTFVSKVYLVCGKFLTECDCVCVWHDALVCM